MNQLIAGECRQIVEFQYEGRKLKVVADEAGEPWFPLRDVYRVLGLDPRSTPKFRLQEKGVEIFSNPTAGGPQQTVYINEPNLYRVIFRSSKPEAVKFQDWVFDQVLPAVRKSPQTPVPTSGMPSPKTISISTNTYAGLYRDRAELLEIKAMRSRKAATLAEVWGMLQSEVPMPEIAASVGLTVADIVHIDSQKRRFQSGDTGIAWRPFLTEVELMTMLGERGHKAGIH